MVARDATIDARPAQILTELADLPVFQVDADRNVVALSPAMEKLTGFTADEVIWRSCLRLHRCTECLKGCGVFDFGEVKDMHLQLYRNDGSLVDVSKSGRVFFDDDGQVIGAIEVVQPLAPASDPSEDERAVIQAALERAHYRRAVAAEDLGMSRTTLWRKMKELGL